MKVLKFTLSGETAFFKKPDVNSYLYFTYGNIHKVALLGLFGAILGYAGYNQMSKEDKFPKFYEKLKDLKISIVPRERKGFIPKKVQVFNNSVGYASKEMGGNLIIKEQWLENPSWDIYVDVESEESEKLADFLINKKSIFTPYLGKNDHFANITDVELIDNIKETKDIERINCLSPKGLFEYEIPEVDILDVSDEDEEIFKYEEQLPIALNEETSMYILEGFVYTNMDAKKVREVNVYQVKDNNIVFY